MSDAKQTLERFNKVSVVFDVLLVILFFTLGFFGLTLIVPADVVVGMTVQASATFAFFVFAFGSLKLSEHLTNLLRLKLEEAVEEQKTEEERAAPVVVSKKSVSAEAPVAPTLTNKVIRTTRVVLKPNAAAIVAAKRGRPKKEG
jgi:hypothetical protein